MGIVSSLVSRNVSIDGHRTSIRLEPAMWDAMEDICCRRGITIHDFCSEVERRRSASSLTAAVRVELLSYYRAVAGC